METYTVKVVVNRPVEGDTEILYGSGIDRLDCASRVTAVLAEVGSGRSKWSGATLVSITVEAE